MPLFDFKCECGQSANDVLLKVTHTKKDYPECECGKAMDKQFSRVGRAIFKGSGFHANDYRAPTRGF